MIFLFFIAALTGLLTFGIQILPTPDAIGLELPASAYDAVTTAGEWASWFLGLAGADVKAALLTILPIWLAMELTYFAWSVLVRWRPPVLERFL